VGLFAATQYAPIVITAGDSVLDGKHQDSRALRGKLGATLATARSENRSASARAHPGAEAVDLSPTAVIGLERSL